MIPRRTYGGGLPGGMEPFRFPGGMEPFRFPGGGAGGGGGRGGGGRSGGGGGRGGGRGGRGGGIPGHGGKPPKPPAPPPPPPQPPAPKPPWQLPTAGTVTIGGTRIPEGATLVRVRDPYGSDANTMYYLKYVINGVEVLYEVGNTGRFQELFGEDGYSAFEQAVTYKGGKFERLAAQQSWYILGTVDDEGLLGATESLQSRFERELKEQYQSGQLAEWVRKDREALTIFTIGTAEGWDVERINEELYKTAAFGKRFSGWEGFVAAHYGGQTPTDLTAAIGEYVNMEAVLTEQLHTWRGWQANVSQEYLGSLIATGWQPGQLAQLLPLEWELRSNPNAIKDLNVILRHMGLGTVGKGGGVNQSLSIGDFLKIATGNAPPEVLEALSDYNLLRSLQAQGLTFGPKLVSELREGGIEQGIVGMENFTDLARSIASAMVANRAELAAEKYGLTKDDLLAAALGRPDFISGNRTPADIEGLLTKMMRERGAAAQGYEEYGGYINMRNQLQFQGLQGL